MGGMLALRPSEPNGEVDALAGLRRDLLASNERSHGLIDRIALAGDSVGGNPPIGDGLNLPPRQAAVAHPRSTAGPSHEGRRAFRGIAISTVVDNAGFARMGESARSDRESAPESHLGSWRRARVSSRTCWPYHRAGGEEERQP